MSKFKRIIYSELLTVMIVNTLIVLILFVGSGKIFPIFLFSIFLAVFHALAATISALAFRFQHLVFPVVMAGLISLALYRNGVNSLGTDGPISNPTLLNGIWTSEGVLRLVFVSLAVSVIVGSIRWACYRIILWRDK